MSTPLSVGAEHLKEERSILTLYTLAERAGLPCSDDDQRTTLLATAAAHHVLHPDGEASPNNSTLFGLLKGDICEIQRYAEPEAAKWLLDMAHDICGPHLSRGTLVVLIGGDWHDVQESDTLVGADYVYYPPGPIKVADLTAVCDKHEQWRDFTHSAATTEMRENLIKRDGRCWVSGLPIGVLTTEGHIFPVTLADATVQDIVSRFCANQDRGGDSSNPSDAADNVAGGPTSAHSTSAGISLSAGLAALFNTFDLGFRLRDSTQNTYTCHLFFFNPEHSGMKFTTAGLVPASSTAPYHKALHGHDIEAPQPSSNEPCPLPGLFQWHYLQCVIHKFGHEDYKRTPHLVRIIRTDQDNRARPWRGVRGAAKKAHKQSQSRG